MIVAALAAGCSSSSPPSAATSVGSSTTAAPVAPVSAPTTEATATVASTPVTPTSAPMTDSDATALGDAVHALVADDGTPNIAALMSVFAAKHGPVPGVAPADAATAARISDEVLAEQLVDVVASLPSDQAALVDHWLHPRPLTDVVEIKFDSPTEDAGTPTSVAAASPTTVSPATTGATGGPARAAHSSRRSTTAEIVALIRQDLREFSARTHLVVHLDLDVGFGDTVGLLAISSPVYVDDQFARCEMTIGPSVSEGADLELAIAHETFHCFQYAARSAMFLSTRPRAVWVREGTASFAGVDLAPASTWPIQWLQVYYDTPATPLTSRGYDTIGFFESLKDSGVDVWAVITRLILDEQVSDITGAMNPEAYAHLGAAYFRQRELGPLWELNLGDFSGTTGQTPTDVADGAPITIDIPPLASNRALMLFHRDVVEIASTTGGVLRLDGTDTVISPGFDKTYCVTGAGCAPCPDGRAPIGQAIGDAANEIAGATLDGGHGTITITQSSHEDYCAATTPPTTAPPPPGACVVGTWSLQHQDIGLPDGLMIASYGSSTASFGADHTFHGQVDGLDLNGTLGGVAVQATLHGDFTGSWAGDGNASIALSSDGALDITLTIGGATQTVDPSQFFGSDRGLFGNGTYQLTCTATTLHETTPAGTTADLARLPNS